MNQASILAQNVLLVALYTYMARSKQASVDSDIEAVMCVAKLVCCSRNPEMLQLGSVPKCQSVGAKVSPC